MALLAVFFENNGPHVRTGRIRLMTIAALQLNGLGRRIGIGLLVPNGVQRFQVVLVIEAEC